MSSKRNLIFLIVISAVIVLGLGIFLLFFTAPPIQKPNDQSPNAPFGNYNGSTSTNSNNNNGNNNQGQTDSPDNPFVNNPSSPLTRISASPIAGAEVFQRKLSSTTANNIVRYIERATGHTVEYDTETRRLISSSNTTIPSIYDAKWSGNTVIARFLGQGKEVKTFVGSLPASTTPSTPLIGGFLPDNIKTFDISPKGNRLFAIHTGINAVGNISNLDGSKSVSILNFPFNEWRAQWANENTIALTTKPSYSALGFLYYLTTTGTMTKTLGNIAGLTTLTSPDLGYVIYSASTNGGITAGVYDVAKNSFLTFNNNPTFPEKCVWSKLSKTKAFCAVPTRIPSGNYPDDWYKGQVLFSDNIYKIDLTLGAIQLVYKLPISEAIDATNLFLDGKEENLYFTNKADYYLWGLNLNNITI